MIILSNVSKSFEEAGTRHKILNQINYKINDSEIIVLLGRSGSGKSTLLNLLSGIDIPDSGAITIDGNDITKLSERDRTLFRRHNIGFVFQFFNLIPTLTVRENLLLPLELIDQRGNESLKKSDELLELVGMNSRASTYPDRLSGGEQQRIAIARALIHKPKILLADEPTGNLDFETGESIIQLLQNVIAHGNNTLIMATHSREITKIADRTLSIKDAGLFEINSKDS